MRKGKILRRRMGKRLRTGLLLLNILNLEQESTRDRLIFGRYMPCVFLCRDLMQLPSWPAFRKFGNYFPLPSEAILISRNGALGNARFVWVVSSVNKSDPEI